MKEISKFELFIYGIGSICTFILISLLFPIFGIDKGYISPAIGLFSIVIILLAIPGVMNEEHRLQTILNVFVSLFCIGLFLTLDIDFDTFFSLRR